jgi:hypothetical protein
MRNLVLILATLLGVGLAANGLFMLAEPANWYFAVPGVTTTGPFNQHFLRDIGLIFVILGAAFVGGAMRPMERTVLWGAASLWLAGHALFHLWEVAVGICGPSAIARDFPAVTAPAAIGLMLTGWSCLSRSSLLGRQGSGDA